MPNRILKESIWRSESLNQCSMEAQHFFLRMIPYPDDFGRFDARLPIIRATLYPLRYGEITERKIESWMNELAAAGMVRLYAVGAVTYGYFVNWDLHQQQRTKKSKYPDPPLDDSTCNQMISDDNKCRDESNPIQYESEYESKGKGNAHDRAPHPPKVKYLDSVMLSEDEYHKLQEVIGQKNLETGIEQLDYSITVKGGKYKDHYKTLLNWHKRGFLKSEDDKGQEGNIAKWLRMKKQQEQENANDVG